MAVAEGGGLVMQHLCMRGTTLVGGYARARLLGAMQRTVACCLRLSTAVALAAAAVAVAAPAVALATAAVTFAAAAVALAATTAALASAAASQSRRSLQVSAAAVDRSQLRKGSS